MNRFIDLKFLFTAVAWLEFFYFLAAMMPPDWIRPATGWVLTADGHWITKLLGVALLTQAYVAWIFRKNPHLGVAKGLAFYQIASAVTDLLMWQFMSEEGIFNNSLSRTTVVAAIVTHSLLGILLLVAIRKNQNP
jgi:hypothetical protein